MISFLWMGNRSLRNNQQWAAKWIQTWPWGPRPCSAPKSPRFPWLGPETGLQAFLPDGLTLGTAPSAGKRRFKGIEFSSKGKTPTWKPESSLCACEEVIMPSQQPPPPQGLHQWDLERVWSERLPWAGAGEEAGCLWQPLPGQNEMASWHLARVSLALPSRNRVVGRASNLPDHQPQLHFSVFRKYCQVSQSGKEGQSWGLPHIRMTLPLEVVWLQEMPAKSRTIILLWRWGRWCFSDRPMGRTIHARVEMGVPVPESKT